MSAGYWLMLAASLLCPTYLLLIGATRGLVRRYAFFYVFVSNFLIFDFLRWLALFRFGFNSPEHRFVYFSTHIVGEALYILVLLWLYALVLRPYASLRLSALTAITVSAVVITGRVIYSALGSSDFLAGFYNAAWYFHAMESFFLLFLSAGVLLFRLPLGLNVRGMLAGFTVQVAGLGVLESLWLSGHSMPFLYLYLAPACYFTMMAILCITLRQPSPGREDFEHPFLKYRIDAPLFPILVRAGLWNKYTYQIFYNPRPQTMRLESWN